ncbi:MAG TPA: DUF1549 and DUF1553 domain-containing protein, partial [Planctomycetota bacterium]|nr:DUF1549 and DUF1553 domain-containing protein [Planctomycetota bacterium]
MYGIRRLVSIASIALAAALAVPARGSEHWSYRPVERATPPAVEAAAWPLGEIDRFVLAELERRGIEPSPEADRATLLRRLSLDLTGLPPSPEEIDRFIADPRPDAYERQVDRLLASPAFGEREARRWLDLARYADSDGYEKDGVRPWAWRFRDWVIDALNDDMPFDRFTIEQLAGDLLGGDDPRSLIATGFHRNTLHNAEGGADPNEDRVKKTVDRANTTATVWLGLTMGCAECHDHKYDDVSQREYFGLYAFFDSVEERDLPIPLEPEMTLAESTSSTATPAPKNPGTKKSEPKAQTLVEAARPRTTRIHIRGDFLRPGDPVAPHVPAVLPQIEPREERPDRLDLARWLVSPENPLTARVTANRIWSSLFGRGLVATQDDFGVRGERPSHPELLDWLASELVRLEWSRKRLIREIVLSRTYRQSSRPRVDLAAIDPENRLLARQHRFRVDAETIRDVSLAAAGLLSLNVGGPSVRPPIPPGVAELGYAGSVRWPESEGADRHRRGLYIFRQRTVPYPMLATFDAPDGSVTCPERERSNTPLQALTLLDDPVFVECARGLASRLLVADAASARELASTPSESAPRSSGRADDVANVDARADDGIRVTRAFRIALGRQPDDAEVAILLALLDDLRAEYAERPGDAIALALGAAAKDAGGAKDESQPATANAETIE